MVLENWRPLRRGLYSHWAEEVEPLAVELFAREVSPHFCHLPREPRQVGGLWLEVAIDGVVLWEKDAKVTQALREIRAHMAAGGVTRRVQHGHPYWVHGASDAAEGGRR